jgi:hypothetical protein
MSFTDRLVLWLHVAFVIFAIGPVTIVIMSSPRAIRTRNIAVLRHLLLMTRIFAAASLGVLVFGIVLAQELNVLGKAWVTASMTLFVVAVVLLLLVMRDQRRAVAALAAAGKQEAPAPPPPAAGSEPIAGGELGDSEAGAEEAAAPAQPTPARPAAAVHIANVERGRIASIGGVVSLIWLVILVLMVWNS